MEIIWIVKGKVNLGVNDQPMQLKVNEFVFIKGLITVMYRELDHFKPRMVSNKPYSREILEQLSWSSSMWRKTRPIL